MVSQFRSRVAGYLLSSNPSSNTGLNSLNNNQNTLQVDWWQGTVKLTVAELACFLGEIASTFADCFGVDAGYFFSGRKFDHHHVSGRGAIVAYNVWRSSELVDIGGDVVQRLDLDSKNHDVLFSIPSKVLSGCSSYFSLFRFFRMLVKWDFKPTRIDVAADDYSKSLSPDIIKSAYIQGLLHGARTCSEVRNWSDDGFTIYLGSKKSDKLVRYYNKSVESKGEIDSFRFETVLRDDYAVGFWKILKLILSSNQENCLKEEKDYIELLSWSLNSIDFYSLSGDKNSDKIYCDWWLDFKKSFDCDTSVRIAATRVKTTLDNSIEWVHKQVETTLAQIEYYFQESGRDFCEWLNSRIESGRSRMTDSHCTRVSSQIKYDYACAGWF